MRRRAKQELRSPGPHLAIGAISPTGCQCRKSRRSRATFYSRSPCLDQAVAYWTPVSYREACGILIKYESPIRGESFVTRKITRPLVRIKPSQQGCLCLGNMYFKRGHFLDFVVMDVTRLQALGCRPAVDLEEDLGRAYADSIKQEQARLPSGAGT